MSRYPLLPVLAAGALILSACGAKSASPTDAQFDARVHAYLISHPEVVQEALDALQAKQDAAAEAVTKVAIAKQRQAIERDPRDFVANPNGKITLTEFYDYRCPHCINIAPKVVELIRTHPDVRFVFKEMPIFGATSEHAAYAAIAVKKAGGDYLGLYQGLMATHPLDVATVNRLAVANGAKTADLSPSAPATAQLAATDKLFKDLSLDGTPAFIVGNEIIPGADMEALAAAIDKARKGSGQG